MKREQICCIYLYLFQYFADISINADRPVNDLLRRVCFSPIDAGVNCLRIFRGHPPEGNFDDAGVLCLLRTIFRQAVASCFSPSRLNNLPVPRHSF